MAFSYTNFTPTSFSFHNHTIDQKAHEPNIPRPLSSAAQTLGISLQHQCPAQLHHRRCLDENVSATCLPRGHAPRHRVLHSHLRDSHLPTRLTERKRQPHQSRHSPRRKNPLVDRWAIHPVCLHRRRITSFRSRLLVRMVFHDLGQLDRKSIWLRKQRHERWSVE